jgi:CheY-like chemotaxis protein
MSLRLEMDVRVTAGQWALAVFEVSSGKRATAAAGRVVAAGEELRLEFESRDWERLMVFATPWKPSLDESESIPQPGSPRRETMPKGSRALVVEDERVSREMVTTFLLGLGMAVRPSATAERALELLSEDSFDLAVLDLALPGMSGLELCEAIRRLPGPAHRMPILILTADGSDTSSKRSFEAGADDFITKPVPVLEFRARVLALIQRGAPSTG